MPKYIIWSPGRPRRTPIPADTVMVRLVPRAGAPGDVSLVACQPNGERLESAHLVSLTQAGKLLLHFSINPMVPLDLDSRGAVSVHVH